MRRVAILVVSTKIASGAERDELRPAVETVLRTVPASVLAYEIVEDDRKLVREALVRVCETLDPDLVLTFGGTGMRPSDWTPEATRDVVEKEVPGIAEALRQASMKKVMTAMLSRGTAGIRGHTLIVNLPGSVGGARDNLNVLVPMLDHAIEKVRGVRREAAHEPRRS